MSKSHETIKSLTKPYKRAFHPLPLITGIIGNALVIAADILGAVPDQFGTAAFILAGIGIIASVLTSVIPFISACILGTLSLVFLSACLGSLSALGITGCVLIFISAVTSSRIRKDLISKWGW